MRHGWLLVKALVRPFGIVVRHISTQDAAQMPLIDDEEVIEALLANTAYPTLGESVRVGCLEGRQECIDPLSGEHRVKGAGEFGVMVVDQEAFG